MTACPFCGCDPFHRTDSGEAVAVTCCDNGDLFFRGHRAIPDEITMSWDNFVKIAATLTSLREGMKCLEIE